MTHRAAPIVLNFTHHAIFWNFGELLATIEPTLTKFKFTINHTLYTSFKSRLQICHGNEAIVTLLYLQD